MLVARRVPKGNDSLAGAASRQPLVQDLRLAVQGVAVAYRCREADAGEPEVGDDRSLGEVADGQPDQHRHREQAIDQSLAEFGIGGGSGIEVQ